jgi:hypothetical protein
MGASLTIFCMCVCDTEDLCLEPLCLPLPPFLLIVFLDRISKAIYPGWLQTMILLISAFWVARIIGVSHQRLAGNLDFWDRVLLCGPGWPQTCDLPCLSLLSARMPGTMLSDFWPTHSIGNTSPWIVRWLLLLMSFAVPKRETLPLSDSWLHTVVGRD